MTGPRKGENRECGVTKDDRKPNLATMAFGAGCFMRAREN